MDCIRSIEQSATSDELDYWFFEADESYLYFSQRPQRAEKGDLMFISFHGHIIGVATINAVSEKPDRDGMYWVTVVDQERVKMSSAQPFHGYAQLRYLDRLPRQYNGAYKDLTAKLVKIAQSYRKVRK